MLSLYSKQCFRYLKSINLNNIRIKRENWEEYKGSFKSSVIKIKCASPTHGSIYISFMLHVPYTSNFLSSSSSMIDEYSFVFKVKSVPLHYYLI